MTKDEELEYLRARNKEIGAMCTRLAEINDEMKQSHRRQVARLTLAIDEVRHQIEEYERCNKDAVGLANIRELREEAERDRRRHKYFVKGLSDLLFTEDGKRLRKASKAMLREFHHRLLPYEWQDKAKKQGIV